MGEEVTQGTDTDGTAWVRRSHKVLIQMALHG